MIFYGTGSKIINGSVVTEIQCPSCHQYEFMTYGELGYFHFYWIPTLLTSKKIGAQCTHCQKVLSENEISSHIKDRVKAKVFPISTIITRFTGLFLGILIFLAVFIGMKIDDSHTDEYISSPKVNDYYLANFDQLFNEDNGKYKYGLLKVVGINGHQISFQAGHMVYNKKKLDDLIDQEAKEEGYFEDEVYILTLAEIKSYREENIIYKAIRIEAANIE